MSSTTSKTTSQKDAARRLFGDSASAAAPKQTSNNNTVQEEDINEVVSNVTPTTTPRKRTRQTVLSPENKSKSIAAFVTPSKKSRVDEKPEEKKDDYIPSYIHQNIDYKRRGEGKIDEMTQKSFDLVEQHFILPKDLETNRKYGPISGSTFEQHAIRAYSLGMLKAKNPSNTTITEICTACANEGHKRNDCPKLV